MASSTSSSQYQIKIMAEYAKSDRSSCKKCAKQIAKKSLRVGMVSRDARGFDITKWHHLECFPLGSAQPSPSLSLHSIKGFDSLQTSDQEALKKLLVSLQKMERCNRTHTHKINKYKCSSPFYLIPIFIYLFIYFLLTGSQKRRG